MAKDQPTFEQGIVCAAAWLVSAHGEDSMAMEMLRNLASLDAIERADEYDRDILKELVRSEKRRQRSLKRFYSKKAAKV